MPASEITNHEEQALDRLITQYKGKTNIEGVIKTVTTQIQEIETMFFQILDDTVLSTAVGQQLDNLGELLNQDRGSLDDDDYRAVLSATIAQYNSEATMEDIINIFGSLVNATSIQVGEIFPASFFLNAVNPNPLLREADIEVAITAAKPVAVSLDYISYSLTGYFGFDGDTNALGFGDETDITEGGIWTSLNLPEDPSFVLLESGDFLLLESGGKVIL